MAKDQNIDWEDVQTGNWNVAKPYTTEKILRWLVLIDQYQTIAIFGYSNIESDVFIRDKNLQNTARIHALRRLTHAMLSLIRNTKFAITPEDKKSFEEHTDRLLKIEKNIHKLRLETKRGNKLIELNINEDFFDKMMEELTEMIDDIHFKLNKADLIFAHVEEYDPKKIKESLKEKYINRT